MKIRFTREYGTHKKGETVTLGGSLAERLVEQGKAVPVREAPQLHETPHQPATPAVPGGQSLERLSEAETRNTGAGEHSSPLRCEGPQGDEMGTPGAEGKKRKKADIPSVPASPGHLPQEGG